MTAHPNNQTAAQLIADNLATGLIHPGEPGKPPVAIALPMFNTAGMPPQMAQGVQTLALRVAEAIVHLITVRNGYRLTTAAELEELTACRTSS